MGPEADQKINFNPQELYATRVPVPGTRIPGTTTTCTSSTYGTSMLVEDVEHELHAVSHVAAAETTPGLNNQNHARCNFTFLSVFKEVPKQSKFDVLLPADHFLDHADFVLRVDAPPVGECFVLPAEARSILFPLLVGAHALLADRQSGQRL